MKSKTSKCLGALTGVMLCIAPFQLVQAEDQEAIAKFSGAWFRPWSELGGPAIKVEKASGGKAMVVTVGNLPTRVVEVDGSRLLCVTAGTQDGKSYGSIRFHPTLTQCFENPEGIIATRLRETFDPNHPRTSRP